MKKRCTSCGLAIAGGGPCYYCGESSPHAVKPLFDVDKITLRCYDCDGEMTAESWYKFFGNADAMIIKAWKVYHCGCQTDEKLILSPLDKV